MHKVQFGLYCIPSVQFGAVVILAKLSSVLVWDVVKDYGAVRHGSIFTIKTSDGAWGCG